MGRTTSDLEILVEAAEAATRSETTYPAGSGTYKCDQLLALAEAASQRSKVCVSNF